MHLVVPVAALRSAMVVILLVPMSFTVVFMAIVISTIMMAAQEIF